MPPTYQQILDGALSAIKRAEIKRGPAGKVALEREAARMMDAFASEGSDPAVNLARRVLSGHSEAAARKGDDIFFLKDIRKQMADAGLPEDKLEDVLRQAGLDDVGAYHTDPTTGTAEFLGKREEREVLGDMPERVLGMKDPKTGKQVRHSLLEAWLAERYRERTMGQ